MSKIDNKRKSRIKNTGWKAGHGANFTFVGFTRSRSNFRTNGNNFQKKGRRRDFKKVLQRQKMKKA